MTVSLQFESIVMFAMEEKKTKAIIAIDLCVDYFAKVAPKNYTSSKL